MNQFPAEWRILITGTTSIHGWPIFKELSRLLPENKLLAIRSPKMKVPDNKNVIPLCITDTAELARIKKSFAPTHIVHCAGVCDLDVCEERPEWAYKLNVTGTSGIASIFGESCYTMYLSTDLVFSGLNPPASGYCEKNEPDPISVAGKTFYKAEKYIKALKKSSVIRLGLPLGDSVTGNKGAIDWTESRFKKNRPVTLFYDEIRSCIKCDNVGKYICALLKSEVKGVFHLGEENMSLYEMGKLVLTLDNYNPSLLNGIFRHQEKNGPPRIGNVSMDSSRAYKALGIYSEN